MSFTRTDAGISNLYLFSGSAAVVFLEGGASLTQERISAGEYSASSSDIRFWQAVFERFLPDVDFEFKSVGSKSAVRMMAEKIYRGDVKNVVVAMDRDFDDLTGASIIHSNVLYSYGYSWENDCWSAANVCDAVISIAGLSKAASAPVAEEIADLYADFSRSMARLVKLDACLITQGSSLFNREAYEVYLNPKMTRKPELNRTELRSSVRKARTRHARPLRTGGVVVDAGRDCFGHLFEAFAYRAMCYLLSKMRSGGISRDGARSMVVARFLVNVGKQGSKDLHDHYSAAFERLAY